MEYINQLDGSLLRILQELLINNVVLQRVAVFVAKYLIYGLPLLLIVWWFWPKLYRSDLTPAVSRKQLLFCALIAVFTWQLVSPLVGELWFRERPFEALIGTKELIFHRPTYSFPSDHALLLFTLTFALRAMASYRWFWLFLGIAIMVGIFRVASGLHWPTDIVGAALFAYLAVWLAHSYQKNLDKLIIERLFKVAKWLRLA